MRDISCLRCGVKMRHIRREKLQLGQTGWILGDLPNLIAGSMELDFYACSECGKVEFFMTEDEPDVRDTLPQKRCPRCGKQHDIDYPRCPVCRYDYLNRD